MSASWDVWSKAEDVVVFPEVRARVDVFVRRRGLDESESVRSSGRRPDESSDVPGRLGMAGDWYDPIPVRDSAGRRPPLPEPPAGDQIVVLQGIPWKDYDALCRAREWSSGPRMAYLDGSLEIVSPGSGHEFEKSLLARLLEAFAEESDIELNGFGSTTYRRKAKEAGVEPDECYVVGRGGFLPDLAIEVVHTSGGIDKLEIYRRLGIREVWFLIEQRIYVYRLVEAGYRRYKKSVVLRDVDLDEIERLLSTSDRFKQTQTVREYRRKLQGRR